MESTLKALSSDLKVEVGFFNIGVLAGRKTVYIESGISQLVPYYDKKFRDELGVEGPDHIILLHSHFDHAGGAARWKEMYPKAKLWGSETTASQMRDPKMVKIIARTLTMMNGNEAYKKLFPGSDDKVVAEPLVFDGILGDGNAAPGGFEVLATPGHSPCSISLWREDTATAFVSDACGVLFPTGRQWITAFQDFDLYLESIGRIAGLGAENLVFGHYGLISGAKKVEEYLAGHMAESEKFRQRALGLIDNLGLKDAVAELESEYRNEMRLFPYGVFHWGMKTMLKGMAA